MLLIGYAVEMYLKAGLTKLLLGCADDVFRATLKSYSHNLARLGADLIPDMDKSQLNDLESLAKLVLTDARYPVEANSKEEYVTLYNKRYAEISDDQNFRRYCKLARHIRDRIARIDADSSNSCTSSHWIVDEDGYLCYRFGGHLPPRITYRRCTSSEQPGEVTAQEVRELIKAAKILLPCPVDSFAMYEDHLNIKNGKRYLKPLT